MRILLSLAVAAGIVVAGFAPTAEAGTTWRKFKKPGGESASYKAPRKTRTHKKKNP